MGAMETVKDRAQRPLVSGIKSEAWSRHERRLSRASGWLVEAAKRNFWISEKRLCRTCRLGMAADMIGRSDEEADSVADQDEDAAAAKEREQEKG